MGHPKAAGARLRAAPGRIARLKLRSCPVVPKGSH
jgi:hypothetical protein